jgi:hypothetical protein
LPDGFHQDRRRAVQQLNPNETGLCSRCKLLPAVFAPAAFLYTGENRIGRQTAAACRREDDGSLPPFSNGAIFRQNV